MDYGYQNGLYFMYSHSVVYPCAQIYGQTLPGLNMHKALITPMINEPKVNASIQYSKKIDFQMPRIPSLREMWMKFYGDFLPIGSSSSRHRF